MRLAIAIKYDPTNIIPLVPSISSTVSEVAERSGSVSYSSDERACIARSKARLRTRRRRRRFREDCTFGCRAPCSTAPGAVTIELRGGILCVDSI